MTRNTMRIRFSSEPPYSSVRWLENGERNDAKEITAVAGVDLDAVHAARLGVTGTDGVRFDDLVDILDLHLLGHLEVERARGIRRPP